MRRSLTDPRDRWRSAALAAAINLAIGFAIVRGLGVPVVPVAQDALKLVTLNDTPPPPPPIVPPPPEKAKVVTRKAKDPEGAAAPPALKNSPTEIKAPKSPHPTPIPAAPVPGKGSAPAAGAAPVPGPGTGRGGIGNGLGSGLSGNGTGGGGAGGVAADAEQVEGDIGNDDYPKNALVDRAQGTVYFRFIVGVAGRLTACTVTRSSGSRVLDDNTCRLALRRFRFRPARNTAGQPIPSELEGEQRWSLGREQEIIDPEGR